MKLLFKIEETFALGVPKDVSARVPRGCVLFPGIPYTFPVVVSVGAPLLIRLPDGRQLRSQIEAFPYVVRKERRGVPLLLPAGLKPTDLPVGSEVFLDDELAEGTM